MGAWRAGLFSDDLALDVKDAYSALIANGVLPGKAKVSLLAQFKESVDDPESEPVFWLAFAVTAWKLGRLDDDTKARALGIIERGDGLDLWDTPKLRRERLQVLARVAARISSPQPAEKKVAKPKAIVTDWKYGELIGLRTLAGDWTLLHVVNHYINGEHRLPFCKLLSWRGPALPPSQTSIDLAATEPLLHKSSDRRSAWPDSFVLLGTETKAVLQRIERIGVLRTVNMGFWDRLFGPKAITGGVGLSYLGVDYIDNHLSRSNSMAKGGAPHRDR